MKQKLRFGLIGKNQVALFLLWREEWAPDQFRDVLHARILFEIKTPMWIQKIVWHRLGWYGTVSY